MSHPGRAGDRGFTTVEFVAAAALALLFTAGLLDVAVVQYATGSVRSALEAGTRAGARIGADDGDCEAAAGQWLDDVLGGSRGDLVELTCSRDAVTVRAEASATWDAWLPGVPDWEVHVVSARPREVIP